MQADALQPLDDDDSVGLSAKSKASADLEVFSAEIIQEALQFLSLQVSLFNFY